MRSRLSLFTLMILLILNGCYTTGRYKFINIEVLQPAVIFENDQNKNLGVIYNNSNIKKDSFNTSYIYNSKVQWDSVNTDSMASRLYFNSFIKTIKEENYFDTVVALEGSNIDRGNDSIYIFSNSEIDSMLNINQSGTIYSLDLFTVNEIAYTHNLYNETGIVIIPKAVWSVHRSYPDTNVFIIHNDTITYAKDYTTFKDKEAILNDRHDLIYESSTELGRNFANYSIPHWKEVKRMYYLSGNTVFSEAVKQAEGNNWMEAAKTWKELTKNKNKNIVAKSMYNLGVACEMEGKYEAALDWVIKSFQVFGHKNSMHAHNCIDYITILTTRRKEIEKVQLQLRNRIID